MDKRDDGTIALEFVVLVPVFVALVLLVLWGGNIGRGTLEADVAAEEAAAAAAAVCRASQHSSTNQAKCDDADTQRQMATVVDAVLSSKEWPHANCVNGLQPVDGADGYITSATHIEAGTNVGVRTIVVKFTCLHDGGALPLNGMRDPVPITGHGLSLVRVLTPPGATTLATPPPPPPPPTTTTTPPPTTTTTPPTTTTTPPPTTTTTPPTTSTPPSSTVAYGPISFTVQSLGSGLYGHGLAFGINALPVSTFALDGTTYTIEEISTDGGSNVYFETDPVLPAGEFVLTLDSTILSTSDAGVASGLRWWSYDLTWRAGDIVTFEISRVNS